ncbi:MAG TPA: twin-arginine translocase subunit TatC [Bryobacteraceae bacterium]|jgi:sec-independent protein translocase protein TatC|nr:twin-arginine translocase subunit TatC [Bryobacteraceae bacterium]
MASTEDPKGAQTPGTDSSPKNGGAGSAADEPQSSASEPRVSYSQTTDDPYGYGSDDPYSYAGVQSTEVTAPEPAAPLPVPYSGGSGAPPTTPPPADPEDDEEDGMLRMSFLDHLEELRTRLIRMLMGAGVAFLTSIFFSDKLWLFVQNPAETALRHLGVNPPRLIAIDPMEQFNIIWVKLPILTAIFIASPWIIYQIWGFIAPGLYKKERRFAAPFVICTAGLFISGGFFAYFVVFRFALEFLLGIGLNINVTPFISMTHYFDLFVDVMLGVSLVFEMPVVIFFLTLLRIVSPGFLITQSRYAILVIVILAAIVTPTPDVFNMMLFAVPMVMLFYVGIFASYLLTLSREGKRFPWLKAFYVLAVVAAAAGGLIYFAITKYGYHLVKHWPFLVR